MKTQDAKLGDFGISKVMDGTMAEAGTVVGTPLGCDATRPLKELRGLRI